MDDPNGPDDEITIDPLPVPHIPIPRIVSVLVSRISRKRPPGSGRHLTWPAWLLATVAAVVVIGALKLTGAIWTSAPPDWVAALGPGVTVAGPEKVVPGHGSPGAALSGLMAALSSKDPASFCDYLYVGPAARCTAPSGQGSRDHHLYGVSVKVGYVATDGTHALVAFTGKICSPGAHPECVANTNPAAIFSTGRTFATLWTEMTSPNSNSLSSYRPLPCVEVDGKWYLGSGPTSAFPT